MKVLGIETSCDETAASVVKDGREILSNIVASQVDLHSRFGGIVPEVASRQHVLTMIPVIQEAMAQADTTWGGIDALSVTNGPGLAGSLLVGVNTAKSLALAHDLPLIGINHLEGHIYANWLEADVPELPALCLIISGGHSDMLLMIDHDNFQPLGRTRDDAAGEAFDKVARILGLGYPGGPAIERAAKRGNSQRHNLPRAWLKDTDDFSFSGLKTAVLRLATDVGSNSKADIAASFQEAVVDVLVAKTISAAKRFNVHQILLGGGVAANGRLRQSILKRSPIPVLIPSPTLCTDNAAMIASCGYFHFRTGRRSGWDLDIEPNLRLV